MHCHGARISRPKPGHKSKLRVPTDVNCSKRCWLVVSENGVYPHIAISISHLNRIIDDTVNHWNWGYPIFAQTRLCQYQVLRGTSFTVSQFRGTSHHILDGPNHHTSSNDAQKEAQPQGQESKAELLAKSQVTAGPGRKEHREHTSFRLLSINFKPLPIPAQMFLVLPHLFLGQPVHLISSYGTPNESPSDDGSIV
jgi:hypothetical protein